MYVSCMYVCKDVCKYVCMYVCMYACVLPHQMLGMLGDARHNPPNDHTNYSNLVVTLTALEVEKCFL